MDTAQGWVDSVKSALRLDPDAILNGEIRDHASAITAIKAAMTGHLMLTTLHANDPINILERLEMEGVQARMIADPQLFIGLLSQRLVQVICPHCRLPGMRWRAPGRMKNDAWWKTSASPMPCIFVTITAAHTAGVE